jgi:hypothetical protein
MLEHADRDDAIERLGQLAIVAQLEIGGRAQSLLGPRAAASWCGERVMPVTRAPQFSAI